MGTHECKTARVFYIIFEIDGSFYFVSKPTPSTWSFSKTTGERSRRGSTYLVTEEKQGLFSCTCPAGRKGYRCKHTRTIQAARQTFS